MFNSGGFLKSCDGLSSEKILAIRIRNISMLSLNHLTETACLRGDVFFVASTINSSLVMQHWKDFETQAFFLIMRFDALCLNLWSRQNIKLPSDLHRFE